MSIKLKGSTAGSVALDAPANTSPSGSDIALTLPINAGSANQILKNSSTAGALEFVNFSSLLDAKFNEVDAVSMSGSSTVTFTSLPSTTYYIQLAVSDYDQAADSNPVVQIGTSSGFVTTGYVGAAAYLGPGNDGSSNSDGFKYLPTATGADDGFQMWHELILTSSNHWIYKQNGAYTNNSYLILAAGQLDLGGTLDRIRINANGTTFTDGSAKLRYWTN